MVDSDARPGYAEQVPAGPVVAMLDTLPDGVCGTDLQGRIRVINCRLAEMFGYDRAELLGRDVELLMPERVRDHHQRWRTGSALGPMSRHLGSGLPLIGRRRDGTEFPVDIALARVNGEQSELSVAIVRDVSDQRRADAERDRLRATARQATYLQRATAVLTSARGVGQVARVLVGQVRELIEEATVAVSEVDRAGSALNWLACRGPDHPALLAWGSCALQDITPTTRVVRSGQPLVIDPYAPPGADRGQERALVVMPLTTDLNVGGANVGGVLAIDYPAGRRVTDDEWALLAALATVAGHALDRARQGERQRHVAQVLERSLVPDHLPEIAGFRLTAHQQVADWDAPVGGDWYDTVPLPDGWLAVVLGDVMGKGLDAATVMGQLCHAAHAYLLVDADPAGLLDYLQRLTTALPGENLVAIVCALLDPTTRTLTIALAGLPPPLLRAGDGSCSYLLIDPMPLLGTPVTYPAEPMLPAVVPMCRNDCVLLFTDGLVKHCQKKLDEQLGTLLSEAARLHAPHPDLPGLVRALQPTPTDEITLLAINAMA